MAIGHPNQGPVQGVHPAQHYEYPTVGDLNAGTNEVNGRAAPGATAADIGRFARVTAGDGSLYWWTGTQWLGLGTASAPPIDARYVAFSAGRATLATGIYLRTNNNLPTNISPIILPFDATLIAVSASGAAAQTWAAEVHLLGSLIAGALVNVTAAQSAFTAALSIDFDAGDGVQLFCNGTSIDRPNIDAVFRRR